MAAEERLRSACSRMAIEMAVMSRLDTPDMMARSAALLCLPLSEGSTKTLDRVCTMLVRTQREAQKLTKPTETSELAERANMILSSALDGVMQFQSAASSSEEVAFGVQSLLLRACPSIRALVKWMTACAAKTRRAARLLDTCSLEGVSADHLALLADAADKCETCATKIAPVAARLRRMHASYCSLRKSLAALPEALEALESLCSRCEVVHQTLCMLRQAQEASGKSSKGAKKLPQRKIGAKATELAPSLAPAVVSLFRACGLPEQLDELQRSFTLARQALVSLGSLRQWREELSALAEPASRMAQLPSATVCDGAVDALCGALGLLGRGVKTALEHGDSDEDADPDEIRLTAAEIEIVKAERRRSVFKEEATSETSASTLTDHTTTHTTTHAESNASAPAAALQLDEVSLDGLMQAQRRRVRGLKRAYTPSVERLSSAAAALLLVLRKLDSADTAAQADLDLAYTNLTSPGAMEGVLATFRQAIKAVVRKAALLQRSRSSAVRMLGVRVKTQSYTSGKWADRLTTEAAAIAKRGVESAEKVSKGAEKLRAVRARLAQGRSLVEAALGLLVQVAGEDRGEAAELACEEAATRCEARIDAVRRATRILNKLTSFRLNGIFKPLVDCRDAASAVNDFAHRLIPQLDAVMAACLTFEAQNDGVSPARLDKVLSTALQPLLSAPETATLVSGYQESGSKLQALVKALENGAAPIPEPTRFTDAGKLTASLPAPSCCDDALFTLRSAMRSLRLPDVFMDLDEDPDQTSETTDGTQKAVSSRASRRVEAERSEPTAAAAPMHVLDISAVTRAISAELRLPSRQLAPLTALLKEGGARSIESFFERAREIATFWNCTLELGKPALEEMPAFEKSFSRGVRISQSRSLRSSQAARLARGRKESAHDMLVSCSSGMSGLGVVQGVSRQPEARMSSVWRLLGVLGLNELSELSELSALLVGPAEAQTCNENYAFTLEQLCVGLARVAASLVAGPKQNQHQHSVHLAASATEAMGTGQVASDKTCANDDASNGVGEPAESQIDDAAPEFAGDFVAQLGRLLGSIDRGLSTIDELERAARPRYNEVRPWMSRNLDAWLTLLQPLRDAHGAVPREKVELLCNYGRALRSALRGGAATELAAATSERADRPKQMRNASVASVRGRDGSENQVTMLRVTSASARLVVSEVLEEMAMMAAAEMADLSPSHALRKQWNPIFAQSSVSLKLLLCCLRPPELPRALSRALRVLFAHFCSYSWHASDGAPSAATLFLRRRGWHALVDEMDMADGATAALAFNCHRVTHGAAEYLLEDGFYSAMLLLASARLLEDGGRMPDETILRAKGGIEPLLLSLVSDVLWAQVSPLQRKLGLVDVEGAELSLRFVQERAAAFALLFHAYSVPVPEDADAERGDASGGEPAGAVGARAEHAGRGGLQHAKRQSQPSRAEQQESVRRIQLQQLQRLHQQQFARTPQQESAPKPSTPAQGVQGRPSGGESSAEHRRVGLEGLVALERHFLLQPRIGYSADRLRTLHDGQFHSASLSLLQLAVLLKDIDDVPKSSRAHRSAASEPRAFRMVCSHALEALRTRLLAFERRLPIRYADAVPPPLTNASVPDDLRLLDMPETAISTTIEDLLRDPSLDRSTRTSQHAWACASFPCLMSEELAPPPCAPAVLRLVHTAQLVITGQASVANANSALKEALATLVRARAAHAAELLDDEPFPPADAVFFACLASKACLAEGDVGAALRHAASAWRVAKMSCDSAEANAPTPRGALQSSPAHPLAAARSVQASAFGFLGTVCYHLHRFDLAGAMFLRALEPRSVGGACNTLDLVLSLNNLAAAVECSPRPKLAFALYTQAHALLVAHAGLAHPRAVVLLRNLGRASWKRGHKGISAEATAAHALRFGGGVGVGDAIGATTAQDLLKRSGSAKLIIRPRSAEPLRERLPIFPLSPPLRRQVRRVS